jgi:hypothetical protein
MAGDKTPTHMLGVRIPIDLKQGIEAFRRDHHRDLSQSDAVRLILRDWLTSLGYIDLPPRKDELN